jgi:hypothetical protein
MNYLRSNLVLNLLALLAAHVIVSVVVVHWSDFLRIAPKLLSETTLRLAQLRMVTGG